VITTHLAKLKHVIIWIATFRTGNCRDKEVRNRRKVRKGDKKEGRVKKKGKVAILIKSRAKSKRNAAT